MNIIFNNINHSIHLYGFENTAGPVIWLLHGAGGNHSHFDNALPPLLENKCRVIVSDVRLHGKSQAIDRQLPVDIDGETVVKDVRYILEKIVEQYGGFKLYMAGFSMGGEISQLFARSFLKNGIKSVEISGIILIASCVIDLRWERISWMNTFYCGEETDQVTMAAKEGILVLPHNQYGKEASKRALEEVESLENLTKIFRFCSKVLSPLVDKPEFLSTLQLPMLLIGAEYDLYTLGELRYLHEYNKQNGIQSEMVVIKGADHMVILDEGLLVGKAIASLFD